MSRTEPLDDDQRQAMARDRRDGLTYEELQAKYSCCSATVYKVVSETKIHKKRNWRPRNRVGEDDQYGLYMRECLRLAEG